MRRSTLFDLRGVMLITLSSCVLVASKLQKTGVATLRATNLTFNKRSIRCLKLILSNSTTWWQTKSYSCPYSALTNSIAYGTRRFTILLSDNPYPERVNPNPRIDSHKTQLFSSPKDQHFVPLSIAIPITIITINALVYLI